MIGTASGRAANGRLLCSSFQLNPSVVRVVPTSAAPGSAADRGRTVIRAAQFRRSEWISFAAISPNRKITAPTPLQARALSLIANIKLVASTR